VILDFNELDAGRALTADVCIVGSGAAGISLALELIDTPYRVLLLEGGGAGPEAESQRLYDTEEPEIRFASARAEAGRARVFGGTTTLWAGQVMPLAELDFEQRDWVPESGWPFHRSLLEPYYRRAEDVMHTPHVSYDGASWPQNFSRPPNFDDGLAFKHSLLSTSRNFAAIYGSRLEAASKVTVMLHANVVHVTTTPDGSAVDRLELQSLGGATGTATADTYVLACGGIETPRLLLASNRIDSAGVANGNDLVGRYFQDHVNLLVKVRPQRRRALQSMFHTRRVGPVRYFPKVAATPEFQRDERLLAVGGEICYVPEGETAISSVKTAAQALRLKERRAELPGALARVLSRPDQLAGAAYRHLVLKQKASEGIGPMYVGFQGETAPRPDSRILLAQTRDALGMPRAIVDWRLGEPELRSTEVFCRALSVELTRLGLGELDLSIFPLPSDRAELHKVVLPGHHHLGATRMSSDPATGVVDENCRVHGISNLNVVSGSVFPSGGFSNPTLTIIALGLRLADRLKEELP
jgi:choline dehydrogenase-like flavoprotein